MNLISHTIVDHIFKAHCNEDLSKLPKWLLIPWRSLGICSVRINFEAITVCFVIDLLKLQLLELSLE